MASSTSVGSTDEHSTDRVIEEEKRHSENVLSHLSEKDADPEAIALEGGARPANITPATATEHEEQWLSSLKLWMVVSAVALTNFLVLLDTSIIVVVSNGLHCVYESFH